MSASSEENVALCDELPFAPEPQLESTTSCRSAGPATSIASIAEDFTDNPLHSENFQEWSDWLYVFVQPSADKVQPQDDLLEWDPWGDDHIHYPNGFYDQRAQIESHLDELSHDIIGQVDIDSTMPDKECTICLEDKVAGEFPEVPHAADEGSKEHESDVCRGCWYEHLESEVAEKAFDSVGCSQCSHVLAEHEIRKLAKTST